MIQHRTFTIRHADVKQRAANYVADLDLSDDAVWDVVVCPHDPKRNEGQNRLAHLIVTAISEQVPGANGYLIPMPSWWFQLKVEFFGYAEMELPDGSFVSVEPRSRDKGSKRFSEWIEWLFAKAATDFDAPVVLPDEAHELRRRE